jgi:hypothetical protein
VICNSAAAFSARVDGRRLSFEEIGIFNGVFVMQDRQTGTYWSHYTGEALMGRLKGAVLEWVPVSRTRFGRLIEEHPGTTIPVRRALKFREIPPMSGRDRAMGERLPPNFAETLPDGIDRLPRHAHGLGVAVATERRFYPLDRLAGRPVINDRIGEVPVVVLIQDGTEAAAAYARCVDGRALTFEPAQWQGRAALRDRETGTTWISAGEAVDGPGTGSRLEPVRSMITDWYGWAAYFENTSVYGPANE